MEETIASVRLLCEYAPFVGRTYALTTFLLLTKSMKVRAVPHPEVFTDNIFGPSRPVNVGHEFPQPIRKGGFYRV